MEIAVSRRERERQMRREAMLDAARAVFAEKGYARATLEEIAQRAEFGKGTIYNYFEGGKEEILFAIFDEIYDDLVSIVRESVRVYDSGSGSIRAALHACILGSLRYFEERRDLFTILMKEVYRMILSEESDRSLYFQRQQHRVIDVLIPMLQHAMDVGAIRRFSPEGVAHLLFGNINGIQMHLCTRQDSACDGPDFSADVAADFLTNVLMDGLVMRQETNTTNGRPV